MRVQLKHTFHAARFVNLNDEGHAVFDSLDEEVTAALDRANELQEHAYGAMWPERGGLVMLTDDGYVRVEPGWWVIYFGSEVWGIATPEEFNNIYEPVNEDSDGVSK